MKKIIVQVALGLVCMAPLAAEDYPIDQMMRDLGYTETYLTVEVANAVKRSNAKAKAFYATKKLEKKCYKQTSEERVKDYAFKKEDILQPRVSEASESPDMIPALLRYHKENPKSDKITRKLAVTSYSLGQYKESLYWYTLTYQRNRKDFEALWNMASIAEAIGDKTAARAYLQEYKRADPNSAWGRMADDILNSGYSSGNMAESFEDEIAKILDSSSGRKAEGESKVSVKPSKVAATDKEGIIVVSGDKYDMESFIASYKPNKNFNEKAMKDSDTLKGNSQTKLDNNVEKVGSKTSLEKASISAKPKEMEAKPKAKAAKKIPSEVIAKPVVSMVTAPPLGEPETKLLAKDEDAAVTAVAAPLGD